MPTPLRVIHKEDPAKEIMDDTAVFCDSLQPIGDQVLLVMYERIRQKGDVRTVGGLIVPETVNGAASEDKFQGKIGLVMKLGPIAFKEDDAHEWGDVVPTVGDWVAIDVRDSYSFDIPSESGVRRARMVHDTHVKLIVSPKVFDAVW